MVQINGHNFKIGADPEFFVKRFGKLTSAYGLVPGTKHAPFKVKNGAVQVDGMALEFNIDPADSYTEFEVNMTSVLQQITDMVPGYEILVEPAPRAEYGMFASSVAQFGADYIKSQPKEARELGCEPDFNAYTKEMNPRPKEDTPFRTASGHVHIGWTEGVSVDDVGHLEACRALTKALDLYLGVPSLLWDTDDTRRSMYGAAGAFRPKHYGMEYRVLSNKWIKSPLLRKLVYHNTLDAIKACFDDPEVGEKKFQDLSAKEIISKKGTNWQTAVVYALEYGGVKSPKAYREVA